MNFSKRSILVTVIAFLLVAPSAAVLAQTEDTAESQGTVVATVNGDEITERDLSQATQVNEIAMQFQNFAEFLMTSEVGNEFLDAYRNHTLDQLIKQLLAEQKVEELGIEVSDEDVQAEVDNIIANYDQFDDEESLDEFLQDNQNTTLEDYRERIRQGLRQNKLREKVTGEMQVSEEEVTEFYEENESLYTDQQGNVQSLESVRDRVRDDLAWEEWMEQAEEEADIEKNLESL
ncbi:MAG: SurA N-terminal domain-containing protein [Candidatus Acetothermia bacterium]